MRFTTFFLSGLAAAAGLVNASTVQKRSFIDVCASVDIDLNILGIVFGKIDVCLCLSALPDFIKANAAAAAAVKVFGADVVTATLEALINTHRDRHQCTYPDHAVPFCSADCGFTCKPPYVKVGNTCVLPPSSGTRKRGLDLDQNEKCAYGLTKCGVYNAAASRTGFECLDTRSHLESCGGCTLAFGTNVADGVDCTSIPGAADVDCVKGSCLVRKCKFGWALQVGSDGISFSCVPVGGNSSKLLDTSVF